MEEMDMGAERPNTGHRTDDMSKDAAFPCEVREPVEKTESPDAGRHWVGAWSIAHTNLGQFPALFDNQTYRTVIQVNLAGAAVRLRLSNRYGRKPIQIGAAAVSRCNLEGVLCETAQALSFAGQSWRTLEAGEECISDPVDLSMLPGDWLAMDLHYPGRGRFQSGNLFPVLHRGSEEGMHLGETLFPVRQRFLVRRLGNRPIPVPVGILAGVELLAPSACRSIVAFGDSITAFNQWTSVLANRLMTEKSGGLSLLNQGISGNRLLSDSGRVLPAGIYGPAGILRFEADALSQAGVAAVISLIGINDLLQPGLSAPKEQEQDAESLVNGMRGLIHLAHEKGVRILGGTITPFGGYLLTHTPEREATRQAVNGWIRQGGEFDGVIDFDAAVRNPVSPERLMDGWHVGDRLHPNAAGGRAMASVIHTDFLCE